MPEVALKLNPTVSSDWTPTYNESGISACDLIRFKDGLPQKLGGWSKFYPYSVNGIPRDLHAWQDLNDIDHLSVGTTTELDVITGSGLQQITPQTLTSNIAPNFSTTASSNVVTIVDTNITNVTTYDSVFFNTPITVGGIILHGAYAISVIAGANSYSINAQTAATSTVASGGVVPSFTTTSGSSIVTVTFVNHGVSVGSYFTFPIPTTVGGVTIDGTYRVLSVPSGNTFTISASSEASAGAIVFMNSGNAQIVYYINLGPAASGVGFGVGPFGVGAFGSGVVPSAQTGTPITADDWSTDNWGEILLACPKNGGVYQWSPTGGFQNAGLIPTAPIFNTGIFVAMPAQILVCYGSTASYPGALGTSSSAEQQDPLIVRWSDQLDFTNFTPTSLTQAGSFHIPEGSKIVGAIQGPNQALIFTDLSAWSMSYSGPPYVFGFNKISDGCGLIAQKAVAAMRGVVYWMSSGSFFALTSGGVQPIPCSVWDFIFQNLDEDNQHKIRACANSQFNEISWEFPSASGGTGENDMYVKLNIDSGAWDYGSLSRSAWIDQSVFGPPIAASPSGVIYQHETSPDADGQPLNSWFETGWFVLSEGQDFSFVDWFFPDMKWTTSPGSAAVQAASSSPTYTSASIQVTIYATNYPNETPRAYGPFTVDSTTKFSNCRVRARQIKLRFESNDIGSFWRLGLFRYRVARDGRR